MRSTVGAGPRFSCVSVPSLRARSWQQAIAGCSKRTKDMTTHSDERPVLVLREYGEVDVELTSEQERVLRRLSRDRLTILPGDAPNQWRVRASSYVGTIVTPHVRLLIVPKVS